MQIIIETQLESKIILEKFIQLDQINHREKLDLIKIVFNYYRLGSIEFFSNN